MASSTLAAISLPRIRDTTKRKTPFQTGQIGSLEKRSIDSILRLDDDGADDDRDGDDDQEDFDG